MVINFYCKVVFRSREDCESDEKIVASSEAGYYVAYCDVDGKRKYAIFHENGRQISNWFDDVSWSGLVSGASKYYVARKNGREAIFDEKGNQVTEWFWEISWDSGLVLGLSDYYVASKYVAGKGDLKAIFNKNGKRVSDWFDDVLKEGLNLGQSNYYVAIKNGKEAIFDKDGNRVSGWFDSILQSGLVEGNSSYYVAKKDYYYAVFDLEGNQITEWHADPHDLELFVREGSFEFGRNSFEVASETKRNQRKRKSVLKP